MDASDTFFVCACEKRHQVPAPPKKGKTKRGRAPAPLTPPTHQTKQKTPTHQKKAITTLLHEAGHAAHFANVDQRSPLFSQVTAAAI